MAEIKRIDALVHPDFYLIQNLGPSDPFVHHPSELELRQRWDKIASAVSETEGSVMLYLPWLSRIDLIKGQNGELDNPWKMLDYQRLVSYQQMLHARLIVAPIAHHKGPVLAQILQGGYLTAETELYMQGEWTDACVQREGNDFANLLGIGKDRRITVADNSRFSWESKMLLGWHKSQKP